MRTPAEFRVGACWMCAERAAGSIESRRSCWPESLDEPVYLICQGGGRGQKACEQLCAAGFTNVFNVEGGTAACVAAGLPVVRGKKSVSLERQVRMARRIAGAGRRLVGTIRFIRIGPFCRRRSGRDCCSPALPTRAAWRCCWRRCPGIECDAIPPTQSKQPTADTAARERCCGK